ncbi:MAG: PAS domain-containing sensor histidine kinase [Gammaproteobacteria bacterium]|nr:PAS domain-containing sensor histidine kinase [Gammaproteobacteria bacterium]
MSTSHTLPSIDWAPEPILVIGRDGAIVHANRAAEAVFGYRREELRGRAVAALLPEFPPLESSAPRTAPDADVRRAATTARHRDGSRFPARLCWQSAPDEPDRFVAAVHASEGNRGAPSGEEIATLRQQLDLFSLFNHDVRQSLQSIQFICDSMADRAPRAARTISEIVGSVKSLLDTVVRLGDGGPIASAEQNCAVGDILLALGRELEPIARNKGLELRIEDTRDHVRTDPVLLRELLQNLMANAVRYTPSGYVRVQSVPGPSSVRIDIVDTGVGIDSERLQTLFDAPDGAALPPPGGGSGLGLAFARRLADALGCRVEASSRPGEGSCFTVVVPRGGARREPLRVPGGAETRSGAQGH